MTDEPEKKLDRSLKAFDKFKRKMKIINPNMSFKDDAWIIGSGKYEIIGHCNKHDKDVVMARTNIVHLLAHCKDCKAEKKLSKDEKATLILECKKIDNEYLDEKINNLLSESKNNPITKKGVVKVK